MLEDNTVSALARRRTIDITTFGRRTGRPSRIEIWWFHIDGRFVITGTPGPRDWYANLKADPRIIIHAGDRDFDGEAHPILDPGLRRQVMTDPQTSWYSTQAELDHLISASPMVEVRLSPDPLPQTSGL